jgi:hypothetical protein
MSIVNLIGTHTLEVCDNLMHNMNMFLCVSPPLEPEARSMCMKLCRAGQEFSKESLKNKTKKVNDLVGSFL